MKKVITVIVTYNRKEILADSLEALANEDYKNNHVIIVDNCSNDGTKEYISKYLENDKFSYLRIDVNLGATNGFATGINAAVTMGCDYVWIIDDDCEVHTDSLSKLVEASSKINHKFGFLSSKVNWTDGTPCVMNIQRTTFRKNLKNFDKSYQKLAMASFVSLFVPSDIVKEMGLPIRDFTIWTDDWEYTRRISRKYDCYYIAESVVTHKTQSNIGASIVTIEGPRIERCRYLYRNDVVLYRGEGLYGKILLEIRLMVHRLRVLKSDKKNKMYRIRIINTSTGEGRKFYPSIEYPLASYDEVKTLVLFGEPFAYGGQEAYMINMYSNFKNDKIKYTFATPFYFTNEKLKNLIEARNDKIISLNYSFNKLVRKINLKRGIKKILKNNQYDVVHIESSGCYALAYFAKMCKKAGVKKVIVHSHCGGVDSFRYRMVKKYSDKIMARYPDLMVACSKEAAKWKFRKEDLDKVRILNNGIDVNKFKFNESGRINIRKEYNISDNDLVFCHVGRFAPEKNHEFLYDMLKDLEKKNLNYHFFFIGAGDLKPSFISKCEALESHNNIHFLENINNVFDIMSASDIFLMPSLSEGLPMVLVEAQCNGLAVLYSDRITDECKLFDTTNILPLDKKLWVEKIVNNYQELVKTIDRSKYANMVKDAGYDSSVCAKELEELYLNLK